MARKGSSQAVEVQAPHEAEQVNGNGRHDAAPTNGGHEDEGRQRPVFEIRLSVVKAAIWENHTEHGIRYSVTHGRLYKRDDTDEWFTASNFGRDQLPALIEALRICYLKIFELQQASSNTPF